MPPILEHGLENCTFATNWSLEINLLRTRDTLDFIGKDLSHARQLRVCTDKILKIHSSKLQSSVFGVSYISSEEYIRNFDRALYISSGRVNFHIIEIKSWTLSGARFLAAEEEGARELSRRNSSVYARKREIKSAISLEGETSSPFYVRGNSPTRWPIKATFNFHRPFM